MKFKRPYPSIKMHWNTALLICLCVVLEAFLLQQQNGVIAAENSKIFTIEVPLQKKFNSCFEPLRFVFIYYTTIDKKL